MASGDTGRYSTDIVQVTIKIDAASLVHSSWLLALIILKAS